MLRPPPQLTVSEWAERHRMLGSRASAEPDPWRTNRTPYLKDVMDALSAVHPARRVVFMKGAQVGATESGNNWLGYIMHHVPAPALAVQPTGGKLTGPALAMLKALIRRGEARDAAQSLGVPAAQVHFPDLPFYTEGRYRQFKLTNKDAARVGALLDRAVAAGPVGRAVRRRPPAPVPDRRRALSGSIIDRKSVV